MNQADPRIVANACVTAVTFPETVPELLDMIGPFEDGGYWATNMEWLLEPNLIIYYDSPQSWTAPRWMSEGDLLFFYHTKSARGRISRLLRQSDEIDHPDWAEVEDRGKFVEVLRNQLEVWESYGGSIFAAAKVAGHSFTQAVDDRRDRHFRGLIFAPIDSPVAFESPVFDSQFKEYLTLSPGGTTTPLYADAFDRLVRDISESNAVPDWIGRARLGDRSFRDVTVRNWKAYARDTTLRFVVESQLRAYLIDHLLAEIKDAATPILRECRCDDGGIADYFIRVKGVWVAVEAKIRVGSERDLPAQVRRYLNTSTIAPLMASSGESLRLPTARVALVVDSDGLYLMDRDGFVSCSQSEPALKRTEFSDDCAEKILNLLVPHLGAGATS